MQLALVDYTLIMSIISTDADFIVVIVAYASYNPSLFVVSLATVKRFMYGFRVGVCCNRFDCANFSKCACCEET